MKNVEVEIESVLEEVKTVILDKLSNKGIDPELVCFCTEYYSEEYDIQGEVQF